MSADLWIVREPCPTCGRSEDSDSDSLNITYNPSKMLVAAGFRGWQWCVGKPAREVGYHMLVILNAMRSDDDRWRAMNPPNGWGDYDRCLQGRMRHWAERAQAAGPDDTIDGWL